MSSLYPLHPKRQPGDMSRGDAVCLREARNYTQWGGQGHEAHQTPAVPSLCPGAWPGLNRRREATRGEDGGAQVKHCGMPGGGEATRGSGNFPDGGSSGEKASVLPPPSSVRTEGLGHSVGAPELGNNQGRPQVRNPFTGLPDREGCPSQPVSLARKMRPELMDTHITQMSPTHTSHTRSQAQALPTGPVGQSKAETS